ncbi:HNH endonuclease signature motif containing protein [Arthrobacter sp. B3I4]|uniref:HNH endonuclease signature motif containing protein n=1 Tax=Arthrobacter sp. B3I4 TaxID=3042267 RepID=UPI00278489F2|nr:HNH endonuclease signature motif containing protein [Arthrobacter sp. B3I4]MDQ0756698.1 hypothetical protein [Arthrobacter sp. B3I4]
MEAAEDFIALPDTGLPSIPVPGRGVEGALSLLRAASVTAIGDAAAMGFRAAADFAGAVEELSRLTDYFQLVAAAAVDRTRAEATARASSATATGGAHWTTGWREEPVPAASTCAAPGGADEGIGGIASPDGPPICADDGYRNTTEFLRARLQIKAAEARSRLSLASKLLPRWGLAGAVVPPVREELGTAVAAGELSASSAGLAVAALDRVTHICDAGTLARMEHVLTRTAVENDPDFLARVAQGWVEALNQEGAEPSEELLRQLQGVFVRKPRHGLQHVELFATTEQFEHLLTVMNAASNPRLGTVAESDGTGKAASGGTSSGSEAGSEKPDATHSWDKEPAAAPLDLRSRPQKLLDGLVGACKVALASGGLSASGGLRPQVMVTIDYRDLLERLGGPSGPAGAGTMLFTGPISAATVRKIACDADIIPVLLGGQGQVLDIGRTARVFPPHIRKALIARDQGCAFPGCTIPASWCEAHHIDYWSRGGSTGTDNGTLLCSHHHHVIHKEMWSIRIQAGIPWFIPPPHVDPRRQPRRNCFFRPARGGFPEPALASQ